jgi:hypothetical protein
VNADACSTCLSETTKGPLEAGAADMLSILLEDFEIYSSPVAMLYS